MFLRVLLLLLAALLANQAAAQLAARPVTRNLLPVPTEVRWGQGRLTLKQQWRVQLLSPPDSAVQQATAEFSRWLSRQTRRPALRLSAVGAAAGFELSLRYGRPGRVVLGEDESYALRVTPLGISLQAPTTLGILRGLATLRQLLTQEKKDAWFPEVDIADHPRFAWRGLLIDAARHFMPLPVLKRNLDAMAAVKLNVLHWHLTDDQAFRVESRVFPRLHQVGNASPGFYTPAQVREVVAYAAARGIRVVPEFDVPSHTTSWQAAYPRLASLDTAYAPYQSFRTSNIALDPTRETTYTFLDSLFAEMMPLFPDPYFHIGGDENDGRQWRIPRIQQFMRDKQLLNAKGQPDKHQLQTYFNRRVLGMVQQRGKQMIGWDEILGPGLPPEAIIQSWRGKKGLADAVQAGHRALLSNGYYLDLYFTAASHYATDPLPADATLTDAEKNRVLGGEATMWTEFADSVVVDSRIWPRAAAVAERLWSAADVRDVPDMYRRLGAVSRELETLGLQHRRAPALLLLQLAGSPAQVPALRTLAEVLEPVKEYKRHFQGFTYTPLTPLNRLVDAAPAESEVARQFGVQVDSLLLVLKNGGPRSGPARRLLGQLRAQLLRWQQNDLAAQSMLTLNPSLREYAPLSKQLAQVSTLALARLTLLERGTVPTAAWQATALQQLEAAKAPAGQAELAVVVAVRRLVEGNR